MRLLALDCSTNVGWALFDGRRSVKFDTWLLKRTYQSGAFGQCFAEFEYWLRSMLDRCGPQVVAFEAPLTYFTGNTNQDVMRLLIGMATIVELVTWRADLRCIEVPVSHAKQRLTGYGRASKRQMTDAALKLGHLVSSHHEADAIAVGLAAFDHIRPAQKALL